MLRSGMLLELTVRKAAFVEIVREDGGCGIVF